MNEPSPIRRTKIVCTIGPATRSVERMCDLIRAGADVFRLNFSHGTADEHTENVAMTREAAEICEKQVGILGDLPGPKLRLGNVQGGLIDLPPDGEVELTTEEVVGDPTRLPVSWEGLPGAVREGGEVYLADGRIRLRVEGKDATSATCRVEVGGSVSSHQGLNLPGADVTLPSAGQERPRLGRLRGRARHRPPRGLVRPAGRGPGAGRAPDPHRRRRHPLDRQDREAPGG